MNNELQRIMQQYVPLKQWATEHGHDDKHVRRLARAGKLESAFQFGTAPARWYMPKNATDVIPEIGTRGTKRDDGRQRYTVYANTDELTTITNVVGAENITNPREIAKIRREIAKRNAAETEMDTDVE